jgi:biopolymer transport protein ExbD
MTTPEKARDRKAPDVVENVGFSMTPMIDIVFQLIIFFMLITDMTQSEIEPLTPPVAKQAEEAGTEAPKRLLVNVTEDGRFTTRGKKVSLAVLRDRIAEHGRRYAPARGQAVSDASVMIRADGRAVTEHVQKVLQICGSPDIRIYKVEVSARKPAP